ncbi:MAG: hypothetical protein IKZ39_00870, partial [Lachnospiraceae bacterium]|nr:hypothetical protein [Lachnospiraceae bacterium]
MKLVHNLKIRLKLIIVVLPLAFSLVASLICTYTTVNKVESQLTLVYHDALYEINNYLLSADRDFYQSMLGATSYYDVMKGFTGLPEDIVQQIVPGYYDDYSSNMQQVIDKSAAALAIVQHIDALYTGTVVNDKNFKQSFEQFNADFATWQASYDVKNLSGDWSAFNTTFTTARDDLDAMQEITDAWAVSEIASTKAQVRGIITTLIIIFLFIIVGLTALTILMVESIVRPLKRVS